MNAHAETTATDAPSLGAYARTILSEVDGDVAEATTRLRLLIATDAALQAAIAADAIAAFAARAVVTAHLNDRASVWSAGQKRASRPNVGLVHLATGMKESLLNFPLAGGRRLRDATRDEVSAQAALYATTGADMMHKARWLGRIADLMDDGQTVAEVITDAQADALLTETQDA